MNHVRQKFFCRTFSCNAFVTLHVLKSVCNLNLIRMYPGLKFFEKFLEEVL